MPDGRLHADPLAGRAGTAFFEYPRLDRLRDCEASGGERQSIRVGREGIALLLPVLNLAFGASTINPQAELLLQDPLVRVAIALKHAAVDRRHAVLALDQSSGLGLRWRRRKTGARELPDLLALRVFWIGAVVFVQTVILRVVVNGVRATDYRRVIVLLAAIGSALVRDTASDSVL